MTEPLFIKPGIYKATFITGDQSIVAMVLGPSHRLMLIPTDAVLTQIVEDNWRGVVRKLVPLRPQGGLSGAMYWDDDATILLAN